MIFLALPNVRQAALADYLRQCVGALRRAVPGEGSIPVQRPAASRFLIAGICGWLLWQPLKGFGDVPARPLIDEPIALVAPAVPPGPALTGSAAETPAAPAATRLP